MFKGFGAGAFTKQREPEPALSSPFQGLRTRGFHPYSMSGWQKLVIAFLGAALISSIALFVRTLSRPPGWNDPSNFESVTYVHPNVGKLKEAQQLFHDNKLEDARKIAVEALTTAPNSPVTTQLRDLLGDINTEIFFSKTPSARKTEYTVKRGDTLISIARRLHSTTDAIARVNKLNSTLIRPGEILAVPHLDFTITIDLPDERVIVHDGHGFFTQYPIESVDLPRSRKPVVQTRVAAKSFLKNGEQVTPDAGLANVAMPWIHLKRSGYVLYGVEESNENSDSEIAVEEKSSSADSTPAGRPPKGIAMLKEDIAQLDVLIRKGTPVTIILNRE